MTDEQIMTRVMSGETTLFELIMRRHNRRLFRTARAILHNESEAEDAVQQAYLSAYEHFAQFHGEAQFATWLTRIAIRASLARLRRTRRLGEVELDAKPKEAPMKVEGIADPEEQTGRRELTVLIERAVDQLPEIYRLVFVLREVEQISTAETAECLEVTEDVVKVRLHRAKTMLREAITSDVDAATLSAFSFLGARCDRLVARVLEQLQNR